MPRLERGTVGFGDQCSTIKLHPYKKSTRSNGYLIIIFKLSAPLPTCTELVECDTPRWSFYSFASVRHFLRIGSQAPTCLINAFLFTFLSIINCQMKVKHFIRQREDFVCKKCGAKVAGTGYTNHCPNCLWSKHVDQATPGDRTCLCQGLMEPIGVEVKNGGYTLTYRCLKCGKISKNKTAENDSFETILNLSTNK